MARPKAADMREFAERAKADLKTLDAHGSKRSVKTNSVNATAAIATTWLLSLLL
jgi:hypothetical protein